MMLQKTLMLRLSHYHGNGEIDVLLIRTEGYEYDTYYF